MPAPARARDLEARRGGAVRGSPHSPSPLSCCSGFGPATGVVTHFLITYPHWSRILGLDWLRL